MLAYFPYLYPDELMYSCFARYHEHSGNTSSKQTMKELFGSASVAAVIDLPNNLSAFYQNLNQFNPPNLEKLINHHTLYTYYTFFQSSKIKSKATEYMKYDDRPGSIHMFLGIVAFAVKDWQYIRFCPKCVKHDRERYGESYWHLSHQLPKVYYCTIHRDLLQNSDVYLRNPYKHQFVSAEKAKLKCNYSKTLFTKKTEHHLRKISDESLILSANNTSFDFKELQDIYKYLMQVNGYSKHSGRVDQQYFTKQFKRYYGEELLSLVDCSFNENLDTSWLNNIVRKHRKAFHPIQHILLLNFLGSSINQLNNLKGKIYQPFGKKPYFCLNPAANHYKERIVTKISITTCSNTRKPVGTFTCSCGFVYSRRGPDMKESDFFKVGRIKHFGEAWKTHLQGLLSTGMSYYAVAETLSCDYATVKKYAEVKSNYKDEESDLVQRKRKTKELEWIKLIQEHSNLTVTQLRKISPALYGWHYRNNRHWLKGNSPKSKSRTYSNSRVDWQERDLQVLTQVKNCIQELYSREKPVYICRSRVGKELRRVSLLEKSMDKLPQTKRFLDLHLETREEYQIRRVYWAVNEIVKNGQTMEEWKVYRTAGLKRDLSTRVKQKIESEVKKHKNL